MVCSLLTSVDAKWRRRWRREKMAAVGDKHDAVSAERESVPEL